MLCPRFWLQALNSSGVRQSYSPSRTKVLRIDCRSKAGRSVFSKAVLKMRRMASAFFEKADQVSSQDETGADPSGRAVPCRSSGELWRGSRLGSAPPLRSFSCGAAAQRANLWAGPSHTPPLSTKVRMSSTRQAVIRLLSLTDLGQRPSFKPAHQVDLLTGTGPRGAMICGRRRKPVSGSAVSDKIRLRPVEDETDLKDTIGLEAKFGLAPCNRPIARRINLYRR